MSVGLSSTKADVDAQAGGVALQFREAALAVVGFRDWLALHNDAALLAAPYGYSQAEIDKMRASYAALGKLVDISNAQDVQPAASNFWWDARDLVGPRYR